MYLFFLENGASSYKIKIRTTINPCEAPQVTSNSYSRNKNQNQTAAILSFSKLSTSSLSSLDPYSDNVGVNISINNSSSFSFLNVYAPPIHSSPTDTRTDSLLPPFFPPPEFFLSWGTSIAIMPSGTPNVLSTPVGRMYSIGSSPLTSSPSMTLTYLLFSIAPLAVAPPLTFPLFPPLLPYLAPGRCCRTWILITYQFYKMSLFLRFFAQTNVLLPLNIESSLG